MITDFLTQPMPWYIAGPLIGLMLPLLLLVTNKTFGISSSFRHACASLIPSAKKIPYFNYDWKERGSWNLKFAAGVIIGGLGATFFIPEGYEVAISESTQATLLNMGIQDFSGLMPSELFNWSGLLSIPGFVLMILGGFLVGFGARYADGCTSGHAITGLATLQKASLIAVVGFFIGGIITAYLLLPNLLGQ